MTQRSFKRFGSQVGGVEAIETTTQATFSRHTHDQYGIGFISCGAQRSLSGRGVVEAGCGDIITVNPAEVHDGIPIGDTGRSWRMLYLSPQRVAETVKDINDSRTGGWEFTDPVIRDPALRNGFRACFSAVIGDRSVLETQTALTVLLAQVMHRQAETGREAKAPPSIQQVRARLDDDPVTPVSLTELARICGLSRFQTLRAFSRMTGLTPHAYIIQRRALAARDLIARGIPLVEVADACGFADQSHMTRIFVRKYGVTPHLYAKSVRAMPLHSAGRL